MKKKELKFRITVYLAVVAFVFISLFSRLFYLQILQNQQFKQQSESNRTRLIKIPAKRGDILDSKGEVFATSKPVFSILYTPAEGHSIEEIAEKISKITKNPADTPENIAEIVRTHPRKYAPVEIARVPWGENAWEVISEIEEKRLELPGISIEEYPLRYYPHNELAGHILGYVGKINDKELEENSKYNYDLQDWIGKTGIERFTELLRYEDNRVIGLKGKDGVRQVEVDARNRKIKELITIPPTPGYDSVLTIDMDLQRALEESLDRVIEDIKKSNPKAEAGGGIVLDVNTGAVLAAASRPAINPNDFVDGSYSGKKDYYNDPVIKPLFDRVFQGTYPPGSTYKPITGMAALEAGINPNEKVLCRGSYWRPPYIRCWSVHGSVDFYSALAGSCNVYFQEAAHRAGIDKMVEVAQAFGMGEKTNTLGIINESSGLLPTPKWKKELYEASLGKKYEKKFNDLNKERMDKLSTASEEEKDKINRQYDSKKKTLEAQQKIDLNFYTRWQPFDTYNISIGQGSNSFTLVQLANLTATIANGGRHYQPYLIDRIVSPDGQIVQKYTPKMLNKVPVSGVNLAHVKEGMRRVSEPGGTAYFLFHDIPAEVGAKTGTAQTNRVGDNKRKEFHGVFLAFTPVENPQIAFAGLVEYGQSGSGSAGHVAKAVFEEYYGLNKEEEPEND